MPYSKKTNHKKKGLYRIFYALIYSLYGLKHALFKEAAFRQELFIFILLLIVLFFIPVNSLLKIILLVINFIVLIVELINSAIESLTDKVSPEYSKFAKEAKDMGSAAVFLSILVALCIWVYTIYIILKF